MVETPPAPRRRTATLLALIAGYYALALATVAGLCALGVLAVLQLGGRGIPLGVVAGLFALGVVRAFFLAPDRFDVPGPEVTEALHPELFRLVQEVARAVGAAPPDEIYLGADVNAYAGEVGRAPPRKRVLVLGLALLEVQTVAELRATVAHELAHFRRGDPGANGALYRTRQRLARTAAALEGRLLDRPFTAYARWFLKISDGLSREQELLADREAVRVAGARAHVAALERALEGQRIFSRFESDVLMGVVAAGLWPENLYEGLRRFSRVSPPSLEGPQTLVAAAPQSHPSLEERARLASSLEGAQAVFLDDARPAAALLGDLEASERAVTDRVAARLFADGAPPRLAWDEYGARVLRPTLLGAAGEARAEVARWFGPASAESFADAARTLLEMLSRSLPAAESEPLRADDEAAMAELLRARVSTLLGVLLGATLLLRGGEVVSGVGEALAIAVGDRRWEVEARVARAAEHPAEAARLLSELEPRG